MKTHSLLIAAACLVAIVQPVAAGTPNFSISSVFGEGAKIPPTYARKGENINPPLEWTGAPAGVKTFAIVVDDPDAPAGLWTHWLVANIPAGRTKIAEGQVPAGALVGKNSWNAARYDGPEPPSGTHRYVFHIFALDSELALPVGFDRPNSKMP